ncbi:MAG: hypothetical protein ACOC8F_06420 [Planctomycetota bacterium]
MDRPRPDRRLRGAVLVAAALWAAAAAPRDVRAAPDAPEPPEAVYYRITHSDGRSEDRARPPETDERIVRVVRITRRGAPVKSYEVLSTGPGTLTVANADHVVRHEMRWNGRAWVPVEPAPRPASPGAAPPIGARHRAEHIAAGLALRVEELTERVERAEAAADEAAGTDGEADARARLNAARVRLDECRALLREYRARLGLLGTDAPRRASGEEARRLRARLRALRSRVALFDLAVVDAEGELHSQSGSDDAHAARWDLEAVRGLRRALLAEIAAVERRLDALRAGER